MSFLRGCVFESLERPLDVSRHAYVDIFLTIIPLQCYSAIQLPLPILRHLVVRLDRPEEMVNVLPAHIFDPEVVNDEGKLDWPRDVFPQPWRVWDFIVPMRFEPLF